MRWLQGAVRTKAACTRKARRGRTAVTTGVPVKMPTPADTNAPQGTESVNCAD